MSKNNRKKYSEAQHVALISQVRGVCPLCSKSLFHQKNGKSYKAYEIAHIYPLNPSLEEIELLMDEERLSSDVNDEKNLIPLCKNNHGEFDNPRTIEEYRILFKIKKDLLARSNQEILWEQYSIESELISIIESLYGKTDIEEGTEIEYNPKTIDEKTDDSISRPTVQKIRNNIRDYYSLIRLQMAALDKSNTEFSKIVSLQIKTFYLKQKQQQQKIDQQAIFDNIVQWIYIKTKPQSNDAAEIMASFFIQNCEVFE